MSSSPRSNAGRRQAGPNPVIIIGVVIGVLVLAAIAVFATAGGDDDVDVAEGSQYGVVTVQGDALPPFEADATLDGADGQEAPSIISERAEGTVRLEPGSDGRPTVVVFLAHWCPHCQAEVPVLVSLAEEGLFDGVNLVGVLTSTRADQPNFPPDAWMDREDWPGERLFDDEESSAGQAYGLSSFPMLVYVDADGRVVERVTGEQPADDVRRAVALLVG